MMKLRDLVVRQSDNYADKSVVATSSTSTRDYRLSLQTWSASLERRADILLEEVAPDFVREIPGGERGLRAALLGRHGRETKKMKLLTLHPFRTCLGTRTFVVPLSDRESFSPSSGRGRGSSLFEHNTDSEDVEKTRAEDVEKTRAEERSEDLLDESDFGGDATDYVRPAGGVGAWIGALSSGGGNNYNKNLFSYYGEQDQHITSTTSRARTTPPLSELEVLRLSWQLFISRHQGSKNSRADDIVSARTTAHVGKSADLDLPDLLQDSHELRLQPLDEVLVQEMPNQEHRADQDAVVRDDQQSQQETPDPNRNRKRYFLARRSPILEDFVLRASLEEVLAEAQEFVAKCVACVSSFLHKEIPARRRYLRLRRERQLAGKYLRQQRERSARGPEAIGGAGPSPSPVDDLSLLADSEALAALGCYCRRSSRKPHSDSETAPHNLPHTYFVVIRVRCADGRNGQHDGLQRAAEVDPRVLGRRIGARLQRVVQKFVHGEEALVDVWQLQDLHFGGELAEAGKARVGDLLTHVNACRVDQLARLDGGKLHRNKGRPHKQLSQSGLCYLLEFYRPMQYFPPPTPISVRDGGFASVSRKQQNEQLELLRRRYLQHKRQRMAGIFLRIHDRAVREGPLDASPQSIVIVVTHPADLRGHVLFHDAALAARLRPPGEDYDYADEKEEGQHGPESTSSSSSDANEERYGAGHGEESVAAVKSRRLQCRSDAHPSARTGADAAFGVGGAADDEGDSDGDPDSLSSSTFSQQSERQRKLALRSSRLRRGNAGPPPGQGVAAVGRSYGDEADSTSSSSRPSSNAPMVESRLAFRFFPEEVVDQREAPASERPDEPLPDVAALADAVHEAAAFVENDFARALLTSPTSKLLHSGVLRLLAHHDDEHQQKDEERSFWSWEEFFASPHLIRTGVVLRKAEYAAVEKLQDFTVFAGIRHREAAIVQKRLELEAFGPGGAGAVADAVSDPLVRTSKTAVALIQKVVNQAVKEIGKAPARRTDHGEQVGSANRAPPRNKAVAERRHDLPANKLAKKRHELENQFEDVRHGVICETLESESFPRRGEEDRAEDKMAQHAALFHRIVLESWHGESVQEPSSLLFGPRTGTEGAPVGGSSDVVFATTTNCNFREVLAVREGSFFDAAGVEVGDELLAVDGRGVRRDLSLFPRHRPLVLLFARTHKLVRFMRHIVEKGSAIAVKQRQIERDSWGKSTSSYGRVLSPTRPGGKGNHGDLLVRDQISPRQNQDQHQRVLGIPGQAASTTTTADAPAPAGDFGSAAALNKLKLFDARQLPYGRADEPSSLPEVLLEEEDEDDLHLEQNRESPATRRRRASAPETGPHRDTRHQENFPDYSGNAVDLDLHQYRHGSSHVTLCLLPEGSLLGFTYCGTPPCAVFVTGVTPNSLAALIGVRVGSRIRSVNGRSLGDDPCVHTSDLDHELLRIRPVFVVFDETSEEVTTSVAHKAVTWLTRVLLRRSPLMVANAVFNHERAPSQQHHALIPYEDVGGRTRRSTKKTSQTSISRVRIELSTDDEEVGSASEAGATGREREAKDENTVDEKADHEERLSEAHDHEARGRGALTLAHAIAAPAHPLDEKQAQSRNVLFGLDLDAVAVDDSGDDRGDDDVHKQDRTAAGASTTPRTAPQHQYQRHQDHDQEPQTTHHQNYCDSDPVAALLSLQNQARRSHSAAEREQLGLQLEHQFGISPDLLARVGVRCVVLGNRCVVSDVGYPSVAASHGVHVGAEIVNGDASCARRKATLDFLICR